MRQVRGAMRPAFLCCRWLRSRASCPGFGAAVFSRAPAPAATYTS